tara:strand:+ start:9863 stop:10333 length:471 start_codon:yes stop_codon:yes gene_type:complete
MSNLLVQNIKHTNATQSIAVDASGNVTASGNTSVGGTLGVTGVHTVGNNAIFGSEGGAVTQNLVQGIAKVWAKCDEHSVEDSLNVTSSTDHGTGDYTITIANDMQRVEYSLTISSLAVENKISAMATGSYRRECLNSSGSVVNVNFVNSTVHGDLA